MSAYITVTINEQAARIEASIAKGSHFRHTLALIKALPYRRYDPERAVWHFPLIPARLDALMRIGAQLTPTALEWQQRHAPGAGQRLQVTEMTPVDLPDDYPWYAKTPGRDHQRRASAWRRGFGQDRAMHPSCMIDAGLGTGKTLICIEEIHKLKRKNPNARILVLAPNSLLRLVWEKQLRMHSSIPLRIKVLDGKCSQRIIDLERQWHLYDVWIHNHESLGDMGRALGSRQWDMVILEEHSRFRRASAVRVEALLGRRRFIGCAITAPTKIALSGTPVIKKATDVYPTLKWLGAIRTWTLADFRARFSIMGGHDGKQEVGINDEEGLIELLNQWRFVIPKNTVINLPRAFHTREITMPDWQRSIYNEALEECRVTVRGDARSRDGSEIVANEVSHLTNHLVTTLRLQEVNAGAQSVGDAYIWHPKNGKTQYLINELLPEIWDEEPDAKIIIWCWFRHEIRHLAEQLAGEIKTCKPVQFMGGMPRGAADAAVQDFCEGSANVFIGQSAAGSLGLNLQQARHMVYYTRSYNTEAYIQSLDRNSRLDTQHKGLNVIILETSDSVDQAITSVLVRDVQRAGAVTSLDPASIIDPSRIPGDSEIVRQLLETGTVRVEDA